MPKPSDSSLSGGLVLAAGTLASRITGLLRDMLISALLGPAADIFFAAFRLPNLARRMASEGGLGMAHAAEFINLQAKLGPQAALVFSRRAALAFAVWSAPLTALLMLFASFPALLLAPGFAGDANSLSRVEGCLRLSLPYLPLALLTSLAASARACTGDFRAQAVNSLSLNILLAAAACGLLLFPFSGEPEYLLAGMVTLGGVYRLWKDGGILLPLWKTQTGFFFALREAVNDKTVRRVFRSTPVAALASSPHLVLGVMGTAAASALPAGGVTALYLAERLMELPLGLAGIVPGLAVLPGLGAAEEREGNGNLLSRAVRAGAFLSLPAAAGLAGLAGPLCILLFQHGAAEASTVQKAAKALAFSALGLPALCAARPLLSAAALRGISALPALLAAVCAFGLCFGVLHAGVGAGLFREWEIQGTALGLSGGAWAYLIVLRKSFLAEGMLCPFASVRKDLLRYAVGALLLFGLLLFFPAERPIFSALAGPPAGALLWFAVFTLLRSPDTALLLKILQSFLTERGTRK